METISVGIYVYNGMPYIREALQSIVNQTHKVDQIVISDNCSTDKTLEAVYEFKDNYHDYEWKINVNPTNLGFVANAKKVIDLATTDFLLMLHADDILKSDTIAKQLRFLNDHPDLALVGGHDDGINAKGELIEQHKQTDDKIYKIGDIYIFIKDTNSYLPFSTVMHRLVVLKEIGFDWDSKIADELYWPKVLKSYPIAKIGSALTYRRYHPLNTTYTYAHDFKGSKVEILRHLKVADYEIEKKREILSLLTYKYSNNCVAAFVNSLRKGNLSLALKYLMLAYKLDKNILLRKNPLYNKLLKLLKSSFFRDE